MSWKLLPDSLPVVADIVQIVHDCQTYFIICGTFRNKDTSCSAAAADVDLVVSIREMKAKEAFGPGELEAFARLGLFIRL